MKEEKKLLNTNLTIKNIARIDEVAESMFKEGITNKKPNRSAAANVLIGLGFHAWLVLLDEDNPLVEEQVIKELMEHGYDRLLCKKEENTDV